MSTYCVACSTTIDVINFTKHNRSKLHTINQEKYDETQRVQLELSHLKREIELRKQHLSEEEISAQIEYEREEERKLHEEKLNANYRAEIEAQELQKANLVQMREDVRKKLAEDKAKSMKIEQIKFARIRVRELEEIMREFIQDKIPPLNQKWSVLTTSQPDDNRYVEPFRQWISDILWDDAHNYLVLMSKCRIDYNCPTHVPIYHA